MKSGYDQFFKNARKAAVTGQAPVKSAFKAKPESSKKLVEQLRTKMTDQAQAKKKPRKGIPWKMVGYSLVGLLMALAGMQYYEQIERVIKKVEISLGTAVAEEAPAPAKKDEKAPAEGEAAKPAAEAAVKKEFTQEEINHFMKLNERKRELDAREEELNRVETELAAQKSELEKRLNDLEQTRKQISTVLEEKVQADDKKIDNLVQMYSNMKPQQAAKVFESIDEDLAVEILARMKRKPAAEIMNLVKSEKAQVFSEKYTGYKRK